VERPRKHNKHRRKRDSDEDGGSTEDKEEEQQEEGQEEEEITTDIEQVTDDDEDGDDKLTPHWRPPYVSKPGMRTSWIQLRFALLMFFFYTIIAAGICLTVLAALDVVK